MGVSSVRHWGLCPPLAVVLECTESAHVVWSEREVRVVELEAGRALASAQARPVAGCSSAVRRADLVLMSRDGHRRPIEWARLDSNLDLTDYEIE